MFDPDDSGILFADNVDGGRVVRYRPTTQRWDSLPTVCPTFVDLFRSSAAFHAPSGRLAVSTRCPADVGFSIYLYGSSGQTPQRVAEARPGDTLASPTFSRFAKRIAFERARGLCLDSVFVAAVGEPARPLTPGCLPAWSPTDDFVAFLVRPKPTDSLFLAIIRPDGTMTRTLSSIAGPDEMVNGSLIWSPDGKSIVYGLGRTIRQVTLHGATSLLFHR